MTFFFDWAECRLVRRVDVQPREVKWSDTGDMVALVCDDSLFLLRRARVKGGLSVSSEGARWLLA